MERGGQWQEEMDISFQFIVGTPEREVLDIQEIWPVSYPNYTDIISEKVFPPRKIPLLDSGKYFEVTTSITGHGQEGEFIPRNHFFKVGASKQFQWQVWTACGENPVYPQGGTWIYDRAGWCPGMSTDIEESDITPFVTAGQSATLDYGVYTASGDSRYIANHQLVSYGAANFTTDAAITDIVTPSSKVEYSKSSVTCGEPTIVIQNTGANALTSATIEYWVNSAATKQTYTWTGNLAFMEKETVVLPVSAALWTDIAGTSNTFYAEISAPNAATDEYNYNNTMTTDFEIPDVLPATFAIRFGTNSQGNESRYFIYDDIGNTVFSRQGLANNTEYRDTFSLPMGCYSLVIQDSDDDGIDFWANNDGSGSFRIYRTDIPVPIKTIEPDFGGSFTYNFTVEFPLPTTTAPQTAEVKVFPNPTDGQVKIKFDKTIEKGSLTLFDELGKMILDQKIDRLNAIDLNITECASGLYYVLVQSEDKRSIVKLIKK